MKTYILYNTLAGCGDCLDKCTALAAQYEGEVIQQDITKIEDYPSFIRSLDAEDRIIVCGGDGTLNRFINAVCELPIACEVLYYAIGTGNDFLHDLDKQVGEPPLDLKPYMNNLPTVCVKDKKCRFVNGIGFGIDGYCCEVGDKKKAAAPGKPVNYTAIAITGLLFHYKPSNAVVIVDGVEHRYKKVWIAATMKGRYYGGGMMTAPEQDRLAEDGKVTVVLFHGKGRLKTLMVFPSIFKGEHVKHTETVAVHSGHEITVRFDRPQSLQIDGETVLNVSEYTVHAGAPVPAEV